MPRGVTTAEQGRSRHPAVQMTQTKEPGDGVPSSNHPEPIFWKWRRATPAGSAAREMIDLWLTQPETSPYTRLNPELVLQTQDSLMSRRRTFFSTVRPNTGNDSRAQKHQRGIRSSERRVARGPNSPYQPTSLGRGITRPLRLDEATKGKGRRGQEAAATSSSPKPQSLGCRIGFLNSQGINAPEKIARIKMWADKEKLDLICITESFLDETKREPPRIQGYIVLARRGRPQQTIDLVNGNRGGVLIYRKEEITAVLSETSKEYERIWFHLLTSKGPALLGLWYRPPLEEMQSIQKMQEEMERNRQGSPFVTIIGDMNAHHPKMNKAESTDTAGRHLYNFAQDNNMKQMVTKKTRKEATLDWILTNTQHYIKKRGGQ